MSDERRFTAAAAGRLDRALTEAFPDESRTRLTDLIDQGKVWVDGVPATKNGQKLRGGEVVTLLWQFAEREMNLAPADIPLRVAYEDEVLIVVDKPRGLSTHPAPSQKDPTLVNALLGRGHELSQEAGSFRPGIVHRLDKETTGLLLVAKNDRVHRHLSQQIKAKTAIRRYWAVTAREPEQIKFTIDAPLARDPRHPLRIAVRPDGKDARTHARLCARVEAGALLGIQLETGRTHQIRVHLSSVGLPVRGDVLYAPREFCDVPLQLHAGFLEFEHPVRQERVSCYMEPPADFVAGEVADPEFLKSWNGAG